MMVGDGLGTSGIPLTCIILGVSEYGGKPLENSRELKTI